MGVAYLIGDPNNPVGSKGRAAGDCSVVRAWQTP
jgi:hypothetical protein